MHANRTHDRAGYSESTRKPSRATFHDDMYYVRWQAGYKAFGWRCIAERGKYRCVPLANAVSFSSARVLQVEMCATAHRNQRIKYGVIDNIPTSWNRNAVRSTVPMIHYESECSCQNIQDVIKFVVLPHLNCIFKNRIGHIKTSVHATQNNNKTLQTTVFAYFATWRLSNPNIWSECTISLQS